MEGVSREVHVSSLVPSHRYKFNLFGVSGRKRVGPLSTEAMTGQQQGSNHLSQNVKTLNPPRVLFVAVETVKSLIHELILCLPP